MCDVCSMKGIDTKFVNGKDVGPTVAKFYRVFVGHVAVAQLCRLHDIQLFELGESRFLQYNIELARKFQNAHRPSVFD